MGLGLQQASEAPSVDAAAMADLHDQHNQLLIVNPADEAKITNAITPKSRELGREPLAPIAGALAIITQGFEIGHHAHLGLSIQLAQGFCRLWREFNPPGQGSASVFPAE